MVIVIYYVTSSFEFFFLTLYSTIYPEIFRDRIKPTIVSNTYIPPDTCTGRFMTLPGLESPNRLELRDVFFSLPFPSQY